MIAALKFSPFDANSARESAVAWNVIDKLPCSIRLLRVGRAEAAFHEFASYERLLDAAQGIDGRSYLNHTVEETTRAGDVAGWGVLFQRRQDDQKIVAVGIWAAVPNEDIFAGANWIGLRLDVMIERPISPELQKLLGKE